MPPVSAMRLFQAEQQALTIVYVPLNSRPERKGGLGDLPAWAPMRLRLQWAAAFAGAVRDVPKALDPNASMAKALVAQAQDHRARAVPQRTLTDTELREAYARAAALMNLSPPAPSARHMPMRQDVRRPETTPRMRRI